MAKKTKNNTWYAVDFETSSVNKYACKIVGLGVQEFDIETGKLGPRWYGCIDKDPFDPVASLVDALEILHAVVEDYPFVMHNATYDMHLLQRVGVAIGLGNMHDTYLMAKHVDNAMPAYDLKSLSWQWFGEPYLELVKLKAWFRKNNLVDDENYFDLSLAPKSLVGPYCLKDVKMTAKLAHLFWKTVKGDYAYELDTNTLPRTLRTEQHGVCADLDFFKNYVRKQKRRVKSNSSKARQDLGISEKQSPKGKALQQRLAELGETEKTPSGQLRSADPVLRTHKNNQAIRSVRLIRKDSSSVSGYPQTILNIATPLPDNDRYGRFHISLMQSGAVTRRYKGKGFYGDAGAIEKGNPQNFPRRDKSDMRKGICAPPGYEFWKLDLASIEARMFSAFMELLMDESVFSDLYRKEEFFNPYLWVVEQCTTHGKVTKKHELYTPYKHAVLGRLYCAGPGRLAVQLRDVFELDYSEDDCREIYRSIDRACPFIKKFQRYLLRLAESQGYISDPFGAKYTLPAHKNYEIIAHIHQGAAGMVLKWWWEQIEGPMLEAGDYIVNTVHDEFDCEILKGRSATKRVKSYCDVLDKLDLFGIPIKAEADKGQNWWDCG